LAKGKVISAEGKSVAFQFTLREDMIIKTKNEHTTGSLANTVRQSMFVIRNFKKRHTSKK